MEELPLGLPPAEEPDLAEGRELDLTRWLTDPAAVARYRAKVYTGAGLGACHPWLGAISSSGHGKFHLGAGEPLIVLAHRFGFQLAYGPLAGSPPTGLRLGVMHLCDEHSCQNGAHMRWSTTGDNTRDYYQRGRLGVSSPLADPRGRHGRAVAIRDAILAAGDDAGRLAAYRAAAAVPSPWAEQSGQLPLF